MEPAGAVAVRRRWERRSSGWLPVLPPASAKLAGTAGDELPPLSAVAAQSERATRDSVLEAGDLVALRVDEDALARAVARDALLDVERLMLPGLHATLLDQRLTPRLQTVFRHGVDHAAGELRALGVTAKQLHVDLARPYAEAATWARRRSGALIRDVTERQREAVRRLIARANREGLTPQETAARLRRIVGLRPDQVSAIGRFADRLRRQGVEAATARARVARYTDAQRRRRAMLIARTELIASVNAGQQAVWGEAVRVGALQRGLRKQWIVTEDERLCPTCEALGAQSPVAWDAAFDGADLLHPPAHPLCRCAVGLVEPRAGSGGAPRRPPAPSPTGGGGTPAPAPAPPTAPPAAPEPTPPAVPPAPKPVLTPPAPAPPERPAVRRARPEVRGDVDEATRALLMGEVEGQILGYRRRFEGLRDLQIDRVRLVGAEGMNMAGTGAAKGHGGALGLYDMEKRKLYLAAGNPRVGELPLRLGRDVFSMSANAGLESTSAVVRHELGHHVQYRYVERSAALRAEWREIAGRYAYIEGTPPPPGPPVVRTDFAVTRYAATNEWELFAESWSAYAHPSYGLAGAPRLPADIEGFLAKVTKPVAGGMR